MFAYVHRARSHQLLQQNNLPKSPQKICCEAARYNNYISGTEVLLFIAEKPAISSAKPIPVPSKPQTVAKPHIEVSNQFALY